jgi:4-hydroxybenzoate polyprenyltransferase
VTRLDGPNGRWLLLLPCWGSAALAAIPAGWRGPSVWHVLLFLVGAIVMRGAGCTWNDLVDRDIDAQVERTRSRPIPSGQVSVVAAAIFLVLQALVGLLVLLQFNRFAIGVGIASLGVVAIYPFMKRFTYWPQIFLGLAFSWGALMGWASARGALEWPAILLYLGSIAWVIHYDTIYAHQDREDDALIGIRSTARLFGEDTKPWLAGFLAAASALASLAVLLAVPGASARAAGLLGVAGFALHLAWQLRRLDIDDPDLCLTLFRSNRDAGLILAAGLLAAAIL